MKIIHIPIIGALLLISACKKKETEWVLSKPIDRISKIAGTKQWHGHYTHEEYNADSSHIDQFDSDTSMFFGLTIVNDSTILYNAFGSVDSLKYQRTDELQKCMVYHGDKLDAQVSLINYYSKNELKFQMDGMTNGLFFVALTLSTTY